jgi:hypothetical protein
VVLQKDEDYFDQSLKNEEVISKIINESNTLHRVKGRKDNWFDLFLRRKCLVKDLIEGKIEGKRGRGRRRKPLLDELKKKGSGILKWKHQTAGCGPIARQPTPRVTSYLDSCDEVALSSIATHRCIVIHSPDQASIYHSHSM